MQRLSHCPCTGTAGLGGSSFPTFWGRHEDDFKIFWGRMTLQSHALKASHIIRVSLTSCSNKQDEISNTITQRSFEVLFTPIKIASLTAIFKLDALFFMYFRCPVSKLQHLATKFRLTACASLAWNKLCTLQNTFHYVSKAFKIASYSWPLYGQVTRILVHPFGVSGM